MDPNGGDAEARNAARKRKMKKPVVSEEEADSKQAIPAPPIRYFSLHPQPHFNFSPTLPNAFRLDLNTQPKPQPPHQIPNSLLLQENADLLYPFKSSFTSLLTGVDDRNDLPAFVKEQNARVDQLITSQANHLKRTLGELQRRQYSLLMQEAEGKTAKRLKDKDLALKEMGCKKIELEYENSAMKEEIKKLEYKVKYLENTSASLRAQLQEYIRREGKLVESGGCSGGGDHNEEQEDVESAHVDPHRVEPILLACKSCGKHVANVMMWPCRHVSACETCDASLNLKTCPACDAVKTTTIQVFLP